MTNSSGRSAVAMRAAWFAVALMCAPALRAEQPKLTIGTPGVPPIFGVTIVLVADHEGFFKKNGVDVTVRPFDNGTFAARAVVAGDIDAAMSVTALLISQISNADVPLVGIWGMEHPDWLLASTDPGASCATIKGQAVGVDTPGGARSIALKTLLIGGCHMKLEDVQQVALGSNTSAAMIAGQLKYGALHIDDVPAIEAQGKTVKSIVTQRQVRPNDHYLMIVARRDNLEKKRDAFVRMLAGLIDAERFMRDPANQSKFAQIAAPTGRAPDLAVKALKAYLDMEFWPHEKDGLTRAYIEAVGKTQVAVGNIKAGKTVAPYERLVDPSVWRDAYALVNKR
ncbi:MAG TPA: ABC transporter substrate-binding protein [Burkholderiales bacterium]|nr:ABC transporter substrate-binding protein [Burkholderiales bacterium]